MPIERSAGAVIFRKQNNTVYYLLLHYQAGHWDFPKGNIERGEEPEETARREIFEETGIKDIEFVPGFKETIKYFYKREGKTFYKTVIFFLAQTKTKKVKISWEHQGYQWLPYKQALRRLTFNNAKELFKKIPPLN
jgi:8-oxo-dGTP pyrophosphatase MutT (NUDIX family)